MRLTHVEVAGIVDACRLVAGSRPFSLYLFGSRVDDTLRGGDIDLLCEVMSSDLRSFQMDKHLFLLEIKARIGEQKIDFVIATSEQIANDAFLSSLGSRRAPLT